MAVTSALSHIPSPLTPILDPSFPLLRCLVVILLGARSFPSDVRRPTLWFALLLCAHTEHHQSASRGTLVLVSSCCVRPIPQRLTALRTPARPFCVSHHLQSGKERARQGQGRGSKGERNGRIGQEHSTAAGRPANHVQGPSVPPRLAPQQRSNDVQCASQSGCAPAVFITSRTCRGGANHTAQGKGTKNGAKEQQSRQLSAGKTGRAIRWWWGRRRSVGWVWWTAGREGAPVWLILQIYSSSGPITAPAARQRQGCCVEEGGQRKRGFGVRERHKGQEVKKRVQREGGTLLIAR